MREQGIPPGRVVPPGGRGGAALPKRAKGHAERLLKSVLSAPFPGELFLAGGAFKPLLNPERPVRDLDIWVRDRKQRERLCEHLVGCGAEMVHDFHPYCIKFQLGGQQLEVTYQNVKNRPIGEIVEGFDIACCAIAATCSNGRVTDVYVSSQAMLSVDEQQVMLTEGYIERLRRERSPDVLRSLDRLACFADEIGFEVSDEVREQLWGVYEEDYTAEEQRACVDTYLSTTVDYKGQVDFGVLRRAAAGGQRSVTRGRGVVFTRG